MKCSAPIGFFDSGVGGVSVLKHARAMMPNENFIFYGDNGNLPYGEKSEAHVKELTMASGEFLYQKGVKAILVACNTATSAAIQEMRQQFSLPVISMEPAIKPACEAALQGKVLVLATPSTLASPRYARLVQRLSCRRLLLDVPCGGLADLLDRGEFLDPAIEVYLRNVFAPFAGQTIDGIVIGCTHYSFVSDTITKVAAEMLAGSCTLYDGMFGTVAQLRNVLQEQNLTSPGPGGQVEIYTSGTEENLQILQKILDM